ncbi:Diol dehydratase-reactivating factor large subunit [Raoultella terrigena]|uniref:Diol dehydratase-reactivating factor large subunit n=1 Tax=Raoultella terrigena TaxID=577 RepID=A0A3P8M4A2_RAOTE|nr:Diol dehydratase-reactivating factor large subunit [Raoultella terrigena]
MALIAGIDIGNATTEVALAESTSQGLRFLTSGIVPTTGTKGTRDNISGVIGSLMQALDKAGRSQQDVALICLNEARAGHWRCGDGDHYRNDYHRIDDDWS